MWNTHWNISKVQPTRCNVFSIYLFLWIALHVSGGSSAHHQEHKTVHTASGIVKPILLLATIMDEMERSSISSTIVASSSIGLTIPDAVCTVLCSWWWAEEPPETCRAIHRNKQIEKTLHLVGCTLQIYLRCMDVRTSNPVKYAWTYERRTQWNMHVLFFYYKKILKFYG